MPTQIEEVPIDQLLLDPRNPRLGLRSSTDDISQQDILERMRSHSLEELGKSFLENGFWPQEALLCVEEEISGQLKLIVVEGNRRLAALRILQASIGGEPPSNAWANIVNGHPASDTLFTNIPIMRMPSRQEVDVYLGYRHVTGIKEWRPPEKAEYIAYLIDNRGYSYEEVMRKIGSKTEAVRRNYIAYRLYRQAESIENIDASKIIEKFSVLFLALRTSGVQSFLGVDISAPPERAAEPVPQDHIDNLKEFVKWLFGQDDVDPVVKDSRQVDKFSRILESAEAVRYLKSATRPSVEHAYVISGGEAAELLDLLSRAAFDVEQSLMTLHLHATSEEIRRIARRLVQAVNRVENIFPSDGE